MVWRFRSRLFTREGVVVGRYEGMEAESSACMYTSTIQVSRYFVGYVSFNLIDGRS
jgi:hypothetical protein